eukprot:jgi/Mesvir1/13566/Mv02987-RA.1
MAHLDGQALAIKVFSPLEAQFQNHTELEVMQTKEITFLRAMRGKPNVAQLVGACNSTIVMVFYPATLDSVLLDTNVQLDLRRKLEMARDAARGVQSLHSYHEGHIVHGDIHPAQFLVAAHGRVMVSDLNVAELLRPSSQAICKVQFYHNVFKSPELARGRAYTEKTDIYSLALVILSIYTRSLSPYGANLSKDEIVDLLKKGMLQPTVPDNMPEQLKDLLRDCWRFYMRRPSAQEVVDRLDAMIQQLDGLTLR